MTKKELTKELDKYNILEREKITTQEYNDFPKNDPFMYANQNKKGSAYKINMNKVQDITYTALLLKILKSLNVIKNIFIANIICIIIYILIILLRLF